MKKIIFLVIISIIVLLIYICLKDDKVFYFAIDDCNSKYSYIDYLDDYLEEKSIKERSIIFHSKKVQDLIEMIEDNNSIEDIKIKNILIKSDIVTISIGYNDVINDIDKYNVYEMNKNINEYIEKLEVLLEVIRKYCKEKIVFIGFNSNKDSIKYINNLVKDICNKYRIDFIDIEYLNNEIRDNRKIFTELRKIIDNKYLHF